MSKVLRGTLYTLAAGIAWGVSGTSGQYLMEHGFSALSLTNVRLLLAGLVLMMLAYATNKDSFKEIWKDKSSLLHILLFAVLGLFINQYAYLAAIHETNAGTATVLQYLCPVGLVSKTE